MLPTWRAGEHMSIIGMTGSGKSQLMATLLPATRKYYLVLKSKADSIKYPGTVTVRSASAIRGLVERQQSQIVLRVPPPRMLQHHEFANALQIVWNNGGWTIVIDELWYLDAKLDLGEAVDTLLTQGRDPGKISVCSGMQRPTQVTRFAIGESTHVISFQLEGRDALILRDATNARFAKVVADLNVHYFAWLHKPTRSIWVGTIDLKSGKFMGRSVVD